MILISTISHPPESANEMMNRSKRLPRLPEYIKTVGPYTNSSVAEGIKTLTIYEFENSKFGEASKLINRLLQSFIGVPGFAFSLEVWVKTKNAYQPFELPKGGVE